MHAIVLAMLMAMVGANGGQAGLEVHMPVQRRRQTKEDRALVLRLHRETTKLKRVLLPTCRSKPGKPWAVVWLGGFKRRALAPAGLRAPGPCRSF